jgi:hypothetical protein
MYRDWNALQCTASSPRRIRSKPQKKNGRQSAPYARCIGRSKGKCAKSLDFGKYFLSNPRAPGPIFLRAGLGVAAALIVLFVVFGGVAGMVRIGEHPEARPLIALLGGMAMIVLASRLVDGFRPAA